MPMPLKVSALVRPPSPLGLRPILEFDDGDPDRPRFLKWPQIVAHKMETYDLLAYVKTLQMPRKLSHKIRDGV